MIGAVVFGCLLTGLTGCDAGDQHDQTYVGPPINVTGVNVGPDQPMPEDGVVQVAFDRYLLASTVNRQSVALLDASNQPLPVELSPIVTYDPIARTVTLSAPKRPWLTKGLAYKLVLGIPEGDADVGGVRAIDRATLSPAQNRLIAFVVGEPNGVGSGEPAVDLCRDVMPIFTSKCSVSTCHGSGERAAASLVLSTSRGITETALGRVAQGSNTGAQSVPVAPGRVFGIDMPIIDPGNPGNSWLLYKTEIAPLPVGGVAAPNVVCSTATPGDLASAYRPLVAGAGAAAESERAILRDNVLGPVMPYPVLETGSPPFYGDLALTFEERETLRLWIASLRPGVSPPDCGSCQFQ